MPKLPWLAGGGTNSRKKARAETKAQKSGTNGPVRDISATKDRHVEGREKVRAAVDVVLDFGATKLIEMVTIEWEHAPLVCKVLHPSFCATTHSRLVPLVFDA